MEQQDELKLGIGTREPQTLKPAQVEVQDVNVEVKKNKDDKEVGKIIGLFCKHPDKEEIIKITQVKVERQNKIKLGALWLNLDEDGLISKNSAAALLLNHAGVSSFGDLPGKKLQTTTQSEDSAFLCIKAY